MSIGILATGAYIPPRRLARRVVAEAYSWINPALKSQAKGERAICNWDEDTITMAVEAGRDALTGRPRDSVANLHLASTTFPFLDRLNAGVVGAALRLPGSINALDIASTQRGGTSALRIALGAQSETLVLASEKRRTKAASPLEMSSGDAAAAILIGEGDPVARLIGSATRTADFVDHYRTIDSEFDYQWEERWVRDAGYMKIVPPVIAACLADARVRAPDIAHFCMPTALPRVANSVAKAAGIPESAIADSLLGGCGDTGTAHALIMLVAALEKASPGERILVVGFGQGADALLFEVTAQMRAVPGRLGVSGSMARRQEETNYTKYQAFNDIVEIERGMRAETDKQTPLSAMWRNHETVTAFIGGRCEKCGTLQFPKSRICVNPNCVAVDSQEPHPFADTIGHINSYTADRLTYSPDPPACYGMIQFEGGGRWMMDFTDVDVEKLEVGMPMRMTFRVKDIDTQRGFRRYFWKAAPALVNLEDR